MGHKIERNVVVLSTTGTQPLARDIFQELYPRLADYMVGDATISPCGVNVEIFDNENIEVQVEEVRSNIIIVICTQIPPVSDQVIQLEAILDAIHNSDPHKIVLVFPYMPYARSDKKNKPRTSTMGVYFAQKISRMFHKVEEILLCDSHSRYMKHCFSPTADEVTAIYMLLKYLEQTLILEHGLENCVLVYADAGSVARLSGRVDYFGLSNAYIHKNRKPNDQIEVAAVIGEVRDKHCVLADDEILTGGTAINDAQALIEQGALSVSVICTHPVLQKKPLEKLLLDKFGGIAVVKRLEESCIREVVLTDTIPVQEKLKSVAANKFTILPIHGLLAESIKRIIVGESISALHEPENVHIYYPNLKH